MAIKEYQLSSDIRYRRSVLESLDKLIGLFANGVGQNNGSSSTSSSNNTGGLLGPDGRVIGQTRNDSTRDIEALKGEIFDKIRKFDDERAEDAKSGLQKALDAAKERRELEKAIKQLQDEILDEDLDDDTKEKKIEELEDKLEKYREAEYKAGNNTIIGAITGSIESVTKNIKGIKDEIVDLLKPWEAIQHQASQYAKAIGLSRAEMNELAKSTNDNVTNNNLALKYAHGTSVEIIKAQQDYSTAIGRRMSLSQSDQEDMVAMLDVMGEKATEFTTQLENFGIGIPQAAEAAYSIFESANKYGVSFNKYSENVTKNIRLAQNYTFRDGLRGLESMALKATAIRLDMQQVAAFANKVNTVEGAIDAAAKLQVLGGPFAQFANPMGMLTESLTDLEGLQDRMVNMFSGMARFNRETGMVDVNPVNKMRIQAAADAMGVDYSAIMESITSMGRRNEVARQISQSTTASALPKEMQEMLKNVATFKDGVAGISVDGKFKSINDISETEFGTIQSMSQTQEENIRDIAISLKSLQEKREGVEKDRAERQAKLLRGMGNLADKALDLHQVISRLNEIIIITNLILAGGRVFGNITNMLPKSWKKGGDLLSENYPGKQGGGLPDMNGRGGQGSTNSGQGTPTRGSRGLKGRITGAFKSSTNTIKTEGLKGVFKKSLASGSFAKGLGYSAIAGIGTQLIDGVVQRGINKGGLKKGGGADFASSIFKNSLPLALTLGSIVPGWGHALGAVIGAGVGIVQASKKRRERLTSEFNEEYGTELTGRYNKNQLEEIKNALKTGVADDSIIRKLNRKGDTHIVDAISQVANTRNTRGLRESVVQHSTLADSGYTVKAVNETGRGSSWESVKPKPTYDNETGRVNITAPKSFDVNLNGSLKLTGDNGQSVDIITELRRNPQLLRGLADMISKEINYIDKGANVVRKF